MAEFFLELFSEEIPARMQRDGIGRPAIILCQQSWKALGAKPVKVFYGPRHLAVLITMADEMPAEILDVRGPRDAAPEAAINGFLAKHGARREEVLCEGGYFVLRRSTPAISARQVIMESLPGVLEKLAWPKSMRWGSGGDFTWVRPLRRVICLLDGEILPVKIGPVTASNETEGHRLHGPGPFVVSSAAVWEEKLREHKVIADQNERREKISGGLAALAAAEKLSVAPDEGLLDEVTGLVEWPVPLIGRIDAKFMDLPPEVRELSMKINQKYFALRDAAGQPAPYFAFVANLDADDGGAAIVAGNERVLRARLADARHFWDLDLKTPLTDLLPKLEKITFHAKIGTQRERAERISLLAFDIALKLGASENEARQAEWAGKLAKADLVTGMVGEFPELQGIMGGYYAEKAPQGWDGALVGPAIKAHYQPKGPSDDVPTGIAAVSVALADKLDTLREFFRIDEKPTGSGDPYALRRCALGVIRIVLENALRLPLKPLLAGDDGSLFDFIIERLRVKLRGEGKRFDVLDAVLAAGADDDLVRVMKRVDALSDMLDSEEGKNLLAAFKRAANILKIETAKDGPHGGAVDPALPEAAERALNTELEFRSHSFAEDLRHEEYRALMTNLANLRPYMDAFFENVTVNAEPPQLRQNRLRLLARFVGAVQQVADFTKIEG